MSEERWVFEKGKRILTNEEVREKFELHPPRSLEIEILKILVKSEKPMRVREICSELNIKPIQAYMTLSMLKKKGMIISSQSARLRVYGCSEKGYEYLKEKRQLE